MFSWHRYASVEPFYSGPSTSDSLTVQDIQDLLARVNSELLKTEYVNPTEPTLISKKAELGLLKFDLQQLLSEIDSGTKSISDVELTKAQTQAFLDSMTDATLSGVRAGLYGESDDEDVSDSDVIPGPSVSSLPSSSSGTGGPYMTSGLNTQDLFKDIQNMKWKMEIDYDPSFHQRSQLLDRLESLEKRIMSYVTSETAMTEDTKKMFNRELKLIADLIAYQGCALPTGSGCPPGRCPPTQSSRSGSSSVDSTNISSDGRTHSTSNSSGDYSGGGVGSTGSGRWSHCFFDGVPKTSDDVKVRPGFEPNDESIKHRASAAAFDSNLVGGLDYKERAAQVCRQIKNANLGDPASFGCIENPSEVSSTYSWEGNFKMVCNRLGEGWGSWYPEMLGCQPYNPDARYKGAM